MSVYFDDGADVALYRDRVLFVFDQKTSRNMKGHAVSPLHAVKVGIKAICLAGFLMCLQEYGDEVGRADELEAECRLALRDCLANPSSFLEHASRIMEVIRGG